MYRKNRGFTLLGLLVVIAIISILSAIVLSTISSVRSNARNASRNSLTLEYINAIELFRSKEGHYPNFGDSTSPNYVCIGNWNPNCFGGYTSDPNLNADLSRFIAGPPTSDAIGLGLTGTVYACETPGYPCSNYRLWWTLEGDGNTCARGAQSVPGTNGFTWCEYRSSGN